MMEMILHALHLLPPETAHKATILALKCGLGSTAPPDDPSLAVTLFGKRFSNPIGLAAGAEKKAEALKGWTKMGFGFVEAGTVTLYPREGNPTPRVWRLGDGGSLINWMGLPGDGLAPFVENLRAFSETPERERLILGVSIGSPEGNLDDFKTVAEACAPLADYLTLNASCPNVAHEAGHAIEAIAKQITAVCEAAAPCPVLLKLGPTNDGAVLTEMVEAAKAAGAVGIVATNTVPHDKKHLLRADTKWPEHGGKPVGGYSGPGLLETTCWMVAEIRRILGPDAPIMGCGGIQSGADALRVLKAGANVVQLYTGLTYQGPGLLDEIKRCLRN